jgi:predicted O-methyltransferase YrrM
MSSSAEEKQPVYLNSIEPVEAWVGYGEFGRHGNLGYENKQVTLHGKVHSRALSTHPPARLVFDLGGRYAVFRCKVGLNEDVPAGKSHAQFSVIADGRHVAVAPLVTAGHPPRELLADIRGAKRLQLEVTSTSWEFCHAVWFDPCVDVDPSALTVNTVVDCLGRTEIVLPATKLSAKRCIATVSSAGFSHLLDDMLGSLVANACCPEALIVVFVVGADSASEQVARKYGAEPISCHPRAHVNPTLKSLMYSVPFVVQAEQFLCLDADMLVLGDLSPVFAALEASPPGSILACREGNGHGLKDVGHALRVVYGSTDRDFARMLPGHDAELAYPLVVNDGIFAGTRESLLALDGFIRSIPQVAAWVDERRDIPWRNQFVFNLALAHLSCGVELDSIYNVQLQSSEVEFQRKDGRIQAFWSGRAARVLHFLGWGRNKYPAWRNIFSRVSDPLVGSKPPDGYAAFLAALRAWVGTRGTSSLAWTFYGTGDAQTARVADVVTMPQFALLHYLIRSNGAVRVLETGTGSGVSTACIASAIAHRDSPKVVTFDCTAYPQADELWSSLPPATSACIERRVIDSLEGMTAAHREGEKYHAALLDSIHTEERVWAEFQIATKLVCQGGLILVHDVRLKTGTVEQALKRIESAGYGVTRLWVAEEGVREEATLGLAVIENRTVPESLPATENRPVIDRPPRKKRSR